MGSCHSLQIWGEHAQPATATHSVVPVKGGHRHLSNRLGAPGRRSERGKARDVAVEPANGVRGCRQDGHALGSHVVEVLPFRSNRSSRRPRVAVSIPEGSSRCNGDQLVVGEGGLPAEGRPDRERAHFRAR